MHKDSILAVGDNKTLVYASMLIVSASLQLINTAPTETTAAAYITFNFAHFCFLEIDKLGNNFKIA